MRLLATAFPQASTAWLTSPRAHSAQATWSGSSPHHRPPDPLGAWANPRRLRTRDVVRHLVRCPASLFLVGHAWATVPRTGPRCVHPTRCPPSRQAPNAKDVEHGRGRPGALVEAVATTGVFAGAVSGTSHKDELSPSVDLGQESLLGSPCRRLLDGSDFPLKSVLTGDVCESSCSGRLLPPTAVSISERRMQHATSIHAGPSELMLSSTESPTRQRSRLPMRGLRSWAPSKASGRVHEGSGQGWRFKAGRRRDSSVLNR